MNTSIIVISGPTGSGKSKLALSLCKSINGEIINADSVQVYKDFNIGSAKPSASECSEVAHHLLSYVSPEKAYNVGTFIKDADARIAECSSRGVVPVVVGGTGLYIRSLLCGLAAVEEVSGETEEEIARYEQELRAGGSSGGAITEGLYYWLKEMDPLTARELKCTDSQRIKRALGVFLSSGISLKELQAGHQFSERRYRALCMTIQMDRTLLYEKINQRVIEMFEAGLEDEVRSLLKTYPKEATPFSAIGYKETREFVEGRISRDEAIAAIQQNTRHFAKRQLTWWRNQPEKLGWRIIGPTTGQTEVERNVKAFIDFSEGFSTGENLYYSEVTL